MNNFCPVYIPPPDLGGGALLMIFAMFIGGFIMLMAFIIVFESATLQLLGWDDFWSCLGASFWMNLVSTGAGYILTKLIPSYYLDDHTFVFLLITLPLSILIEWGVLEIRKPGERWHNLRALIVANLVSYVLVITPAYFLLAN